MQDRTSLIPMLDVHDDQEYLVLSRPRIDVCVSGKVWSGAGEVRLEFMPFPEIYVHASLKAAEIPLSPEGSRVLPTGEGLKIEGRPLVAMLRKVAFPSTKPLVYDLGFRPTSQTLKALGDKESRMTRVLFHLFDLEAPGTPYSSVGSLSANEDDLHLELRSETWQMRFRRLTRKNKDSSHSVMSGGYRLTTVGELSKCSKQEFVGEEAEYIVEACRYFLSLTRGNNCIPVCPVGLNGANEAVWSLWSAPREWGPLMFNLFDGYETEQLDALFHGFMKTWEREGWRDALISAIWWYVNANHSSQSIDAGLVFSQAAIERLSYEYCVCDKEFISEQGFGMLKAADQYRLLLSTLSIPFGIPSCAVALRAEARGRNWNDGPQALTEIRNKLIHGGTKKAKLSDDCYLDAWKLGMWFLEMVLLRLCAYRGDYRNRNNNLWERVPWQQCETYP